ncbi:hypothetical protein [Haladaptatus salinisoli]|uniref:hypothetical protein n=1 Tax=Haladaptatus salinisoli TaxID=2884876 RepID=UPI001D0B7DE7|nr:hypothetical protein [Haladaptatus salinisoli]
MIQQLPSTPVDTLARIVGLAVLSGAVAGAVAFAHRWYARERIPNGVAVLAGIGAVGIATSTWRTLQPFLGGTQDLVAPTEAAVTVVSFVLAGLTALVGARLGDRLTTNVAALSGATKLDDDVSRIVGAVGRVVAVTLPESIHDIDGHDAVSEGTKEELAGSTFLFPRGLTVAELRERLVARLKDDHGVGYADVDLAADGTVEYLALGSRVAGLGPTLAPGTVAVALRADPAFSAGVGDAVAVWRRDEDGAERVVTGELRGVAEDVATVAVDATEARKLDATERYRLVTLPTRDRPEREFAARLRAAAETIGAVTVAPGSDLVGVPVGSLDAAVVAVHPESGPVEPLPLRSRTLAESDTLYVVARPSLLRRIERAADDRAGEPARVFK